MAGLACASTNPNSDNELLAHEKNILELEHPPTTPTNALIVAWPQPRHVQQVGHEHRDTDLGLDPICEQIDDFDVKVGRVEVARDTQVALLRLQDAEGTLHRLLHRAGHTAREDLA